MAPELRGSDLASVREQLGREPTVPFAVAVRCPAGHPLAIRNGVRDADGTPFPTGAWLTCPEAVKVVSRLEAAGAIKELSARFDADPAFRSEVEAAHAEAAARRDTQEPGAGAWGGVGGTRRGLKCLHAHYANHLDGAEDAVGGWVAERVEPPHGAAPEEVVAAIDQGTNSSRLSVLARMGDDVVELARDMVITRLGEGVDATGRLDPAAIARTEEVLARYGRRAHALGATRIVVGATSAVRDAANQEDFARAVRRATGVEPEVIDGECEAALTFRGGTQGLDPGGGPFMVIDIGGGSTELVLGDPRSVPSAAVSLQVGSVRLRERIGHGDSVTSEMAALDAAVAPFLDDAEPVVGRGARTLVGVGGTPTTLQAYALGLDRDDPDVLHGSRLSLSNVEAGRTALAAMTAAERDALPFMPKGRGDVIVSGAAILAGVMRRFGFSEVVVSECDILDALAWEALSVR